MSNWWDDHGTKILGTVTVVVGAASTFVSTILPNLRAVDPKRAPYWELTAQVLAASTAALGALTVKRGFTNSQPNP